MVVQRAQWAAALKRQQLPGTACSAQIYLRYGL